MALINNIYVHVVEEGVNNDVNTVSHPTESGFAVSSSIRKQPISLNISGNIVGTDNMTAKQVADKLKKLQLDGSLITYKGACGTLQNLQIQSFNDSYNNRVNGGAGFSMTLKEIKTAKKRMLSVKCLLYP